MATSGTRSPREGRLTQVTGSDSGNGHVTCVRNQQEPFIQAKEITSKLHSGNIKHLKGFFKDG